MSQSRRRRHGNAVRATEQRDFWVGGVDEDGDDIAEPITRAEEPAAMIMSLGPAPLPGRETIAEHYFAAIYDRAATLASAVAASANLLGDDAEPDDLAPGDAG
jgi:hypothetical protein